MFTLSEKYFFNKKFIAEYMAETKYTIRRITLKDTVSPFPLHFDN